MIIIAIPIVSWSAPVLTCVVSRGFGVDGRMAATSLFRSPTRTGVTAAAIALVLTTTLVLRSLSVSFRDGAEQYLGTFAAADLVISAIATEGGYLETHFPIALPRNW